MSARPKVAIFSDIRFPSPRANGIQVVKTAHALAARGLDTRLVVRQSDPRDTGEILEGYGIESGSRLVVERIAVGHGRGPQNLARLRYLVATVFRARRAVSQGRTVLTRDLQLADLLLRTGCRTLAYEAHAVEAIMYDERHQLYATAERPSPAKRRRIFGRERRVWMGARGFIATTQGILTTFERQFGPRPRTAVVPNGCDLPGDRVFEPPAEDGRVIYAGQLYPWKGVDVLLRAFARVGLGTLVVVGGIEGEGDLARVRALAEELGIAQRVFFLGPKPQKEIAGELAKATVAVAPFLKTAMTSEHTSPIKAFEAMAAGRPLLISDTAAAREIVEDGRTGLLVPAGDVEAWANALARILADRDLQMQLARGAFEKATLYSWARRAERLEQFLGAAA